jgi:hypothetical protein
MNLYGYSSVDNENLDLLSLRDVSILASSEELLALAAFFAKCAFEMQREESWDHAHFGDFFGNSSRLDVDIIVASSKKEPA